MDAMRGRGSEEVGVPTFSTTKSSDMSAVPLRNSAKPGRRSASMLDEVALTAEIGIETTWKRKEHGK